MATPEEALSTYQSLIEGTVTIGAQARDELAKQLSAFGFSTEASKLVGNAAEELRALEEKRRAQNERIRALDKEILLRARLEEYSIMRVYAREKVHVAPQFKFNKLVHPSIGHERESGVEPIKEAKLESMLDVFGSAEDVVVPIYELESDSGNKYLLRCGYSKDFPLVYSYDSDVQTFCEAMVEDALRCLGLNHGELKCHREKLFYGYGVDIIVVTMMEKMVFVIEVKSPEHKDGEVFENGLVGGEIFLYLMAMKQLGVKKPMGAISTFNKMQIVTLEDFVDKSAVIESRERLRTDTVTPQEVRDEHEKESTSPIISFEDAIPKDDGDLESDKDVDRKILRSEVYNAKGVFPMLLLALRSAYATCIREKQVLSKLPVINEGDDLSGRLLFHMTEKSGEFVYAKKNLIASLDEIDAHSTEFYMLTQLDSGLYGNVYLACNTAGKLVCVKLYSYGKSQAKTPEERTEVNEERVNAAKKVRDREYAIWKKMYPHFGTRHIQLHGLPALLMPFGEKLVASSQERETCLGPIENILISFAKKGYYFPWRQDLRWSHVVLIKGKVHLVGLGSLEKNAKKMSKKSIELVVQDQMQGLKNIMEY